MSGLSVTVDEALLLVKVPLRGFYPTGVVQSVFEFWCEEIADEDDLVPAESLEIFVASCKALQCPEAGTVAFDPSCRYPGGIEFHAGHTKTHTIRTSNRAIASI